MPPAQGCRAEGGGSHDPQVHARWTGRDLGLSGLGGGVDRDGTESQYRLPPDWQYTKIQEAITAASEGDTIQVRAGTYVESLQIIKRLTLQGESRDKVILQGTVVIFNTKLVTMSGFTVKGGQGVHIEGTTIVLSGNAFVESALKGLLARNSSITVRGNLVSKNKTHGSLLILGSKALITGNTITDNGGDGINVAASQADIRDNLIQGDVGCGGPGRCRLHHHGQRHASEHQRQQGREPMREGR